MSRSTLIGIALTIAAATAAAGCGDDGDRGTAATTRPAAPAAERTLARLERIVRERVDSGRSTGIVAGVVLPDGTTRVFAYGDAGAGKRLGPSSVFEIGSITKVFTGSLLADAVQRGEVKPGDPVSRLLPPGVDVPAKGGRQITLVDLATQTSGLPTVPADFRPEDPANPPMPTTRSSSSTRPWRASG